MQFWLLDIRPLCDERPLAIAQRVVCPQRAEKAMAHRHVIDQARSIGAGLLMDKLKAEKCPEAAIALEENGKPFFQTTLDAPVFNLSHSGFYVLFGFGSVELGVDIETTMPRALATIGRVCSADEREWIEHAEDEDVRVQRFFRVWTRKEAYLKLTGEGLVADLTTLDVQAKHPIRDGLVKTQYRFFDLDVPQGYSASLCVSADLPEEELSELAAGVKFERIDVLELLREAALRKKLVRD